MINKKWILFNIFIFICLNVKGNNVEITLSSTWNSSVVYPILETSEFIAEENPILFWEYINYLTKLPEPIQYNKNVDYYYKLAINTAKKTFEEEKDLIKILELSLSTRSYSVKIEMNHQLSLESKALVCKGISPNVWAIVYDSDNNNINSACIRAVLCTKEDLINFLDGMKNKSKSSYITASTNDFIMEFDHTYPLKFNKNTDTKTSFIVYGLIGSIEFNFFHKKLFPLAKNNEIIYSIRHHSLQNKKTTLLQGYGIALDVKNMEYKAIDKLDDNNTLRLNEETEEDKFFYTFLNKKENDIKDEFKKLNDQIKKKNDKIKNDEQINNRRWDISNIGLLATKDIIEDTTNPLNKLMDVALNFPKYAKNYAYNSINNKLKTINKVGKKNLKLLKKKIEENYESIDKLEINQYNPMDPNKNNILVFNGFSINPNEMMFNSFELIKRIRKEVSMISNLKKNQSYNLLYGNNKEYKKFLDFREEMIKISKDKPIPRVNLMPKKGLIFSLNDIELDEFYDDWPNDPKILLQSENIPSLVYLRQNMYRLTLILDPFSLEGFEVINSCFFLIRRQAPIKIGIIIYSKKLDTLFMENKSPDENYIRKIVKLHGKRALDNEKVSIIHLMKLFHGISILYNSNNDNNNIIIQFFTGLEMLLRKSEKNEFTVKHLGQFYVNIMKTFSKKKKGSIKAEAFDVMFSEFEDMEINDRINGRVVNNIFTILNRRLPFPCLLFNGIVSKNLDFQRGLMLLLTQEQKKYISIYKRVHQENSNVDLYEMLFNSEQSNVYDKYFEFMDDAADVNYISFLNSNRIEKFRYFHSLPSTDLKKSTFIIMSSDNLLSLKNIKFVQTCFEYLLDNANKDEFRISFVFDYKQEPNIFCTPKKEDNIKAIDLLAYILLHISKDIDNFETIKYINDLIKRILNQGSSSNALNELSQDTLLVKDFLQYKKSSICVARPQEIKLLLNEANLESNNHNIIVNGLIIPIASDTEFNTLLLKDIIKFSTTKITPIFNYVKKSFVSNGNNSEKHYSRNKNDFLLHLSIFFGNYLKTDRIYVPTLAKDKLPKKKNNAIIHLDNGNNDYKIIAFLDPLSEFTQKCMAFINFFYSVLNADLTIYLIPEKSYKIFPLKRFYRFLFKTYSNNDTDNFNHKRNVIEFNDLTSSAVYTMKLETPEQWDVQIKSSDLDLDNIMFNNMNETIFVEYKLKHLLAYGQCRDITNNKYNEPPNGLQLLLKRFKLNDNMNNDDVMGDTLVMKNLGYFQFRATPGVWFLSLAEGRGRKLFNIHKTMNSDLKNNTVNKKKIVINDFNTDIIQLFVHKKKNREKLHLLYDNNNKNGELAGNDNIDEEDEDISIKDKIKTEDNSLSFDYSYKNIINYYRVWFTKYISSNHSFLNRIIQVYKKTIFGEKSDDDKNDKNGNMNELNKKISSNIINNNTTVHDDERIHVFSLASGHLYERFLKIMMLSVKKRNENKNPITFWLLENFLSPRFKEKAIGTLRKKFNLDIQLVTYKWPSWLHKQSEKQRIIWGYKILFLDVLFPLNVNKIIYVDADQVVRNDLSELWNIDLEGKVYGYVPFCNDRNKGFQFWRQGYWASHLQGLSYHISALYVVDLKRFRQIAAGDQLRAIYDHLSRDENSLANLDQDLPNYAQHQIPIYSLPQEWLWCESWCSEKSKKKAKTIDLCNNPKHKEPKLNMAKRIINGSLFQESWIELDTIISNAEKEEEIEIEINTNVSEMDKKVYDTEGKVEKTEL